MPLTFSLLRPEDLLALSIELRNLRLDNSNPKKPQLVIDKTGQPAYVIIHFPPQSITEKAYFETAPIAAPSFNPPPPGPDPGGSDPLDPPGSVPARMVGPSRLVFEVAKGFKSIPFSMEGLLDWSALKLVVSPTAAAPQKPPFPAGLKIAPPKDLETALELCYRLILSPDSNVGWLHSKTPVTHSGRTELWHTRMARLITQAKPPSVVPADATELRPIPLRAIWSPDFVDHGPLPGAFDNGPFLAATSPSDRDQIVILTSGFEGYYSFANDSRVPFVPTSVRASRVFLSSLGGWLSSRGNWTNPPSYDTQDQGSYSLDLIEWDHLSTLGRDHYVKIVYEGFLYPFGHRASLVKVTERKIVGTDESPVNSPVAYLRQRMYIVVREQSKSYTGAAYKYKGLEMPFASQIDVKTTVTPEIDQPVASAVPGASDSFWVRVGGADFPFQLFGRDLVAARIDFSAPLIFISNSETNITAVQNAYASSGDRRACLVHSKKITYADPTIGDTALKTTALYFDTQLLKTTSPFGNVPFIPKLDDNLAANVTIPAISELLGISPATQIHFYSKYLAAGFDPNAGVFAEINNPPVVSFPADKAGGFATPKISVTGLSARKGLVGGSPDDAAGGLIDPTAFFGDIDAKLFGTIPLPNLIPIDAITKKAGAAKNAPEIHTQVLPNHKNPQTLKTIVHWEPELTDFELNPVKVEFNTDGNKSGLTLNATLQRYLNGSPSTSQVHGALSNFLITLFDVIGLRITSITFDSTNGSKTMVAAHLPASKPIAFLGALAFIQTLADILPPGLFGGYGPSIVLGPSAIQVSYTLALPTISVGVFALSGISITTGLDLPYLDGKPAFEFAFAKRNAPFLITVECLGGGGYVHLIVNADGVQMVEGALEFGGQFAFDIGVATGGVHVMAGIYFQVTGTSTTLTGFVDIGGEVSILGIISISIDLNLSLTFVHTAQGDKVRGRATLTVSIHIIFFSISVQLSVERSFGNAPGDPRVHQLIAPTDWAAYAAAFA